MKRAKDLYQKIISIETLRVATDYASRGKRRRKDVIRFERHKEDKLTQLNKILAEEKYNPIPYTNKTIQDRCTGKVREIFVPKFFPDQIVQWSLMLHLKPILMRGMYDYCCASIDGRGGTYGINAIKHWLKDEKNTKYCLICDVRKFYPSVDQNILMQKFNRKLKDSKTLNLIGKIVHSVEKGLPIGNFTSQWFANFYLQDFDHYVKEQLKIKYYLRYMDDMVFFSSNKRKLSAQQKQIEQYLNNEHLTIKPNWQIFKVAQNKQDKTGKAIDVLGYKFYRTYTTMRGRTFLRTTRRLRKIAKKPYLTAKDSSAALSYNARIKATSGNIFYNKYVKPYINIGKCRWTVSRHDRKKANEEKLKQSNGNDEET